jgi:hypothetical protein
MEQHDRQHDHAQRMRGNSTLAIGTPLARLFFEPQNTMVISSSRSKPSAREP